MLLRRLLFGVVMAAMPTFAANAAGLKPPTPVIHKGACPFECCTYRDWTTTKPVALVDRPRGTKRVATVAAGKIVHGVTGEVIAEPITLHAHRDYEESPIRAGDAFYALHSAGEGFWAVWYRGRIYNLELEGTEFHGGWPPNKYEWWVKIRTRQGMTGWALEQDQFENQDACG